jgi:hypothetical protein
VTERVQPGGFGFVRRSPTELVVVPTLDSWEARQFPAAAVDRLRPRRSRHVVGALLGVLLAAAGTAATAPGVVPALAPDVVRGSAVVVWAVASFLLHTRGHPVGHLLGGVGGAVSGLLVGGPVAGAALVLALNGTLAVPAWIGVASRARWWPRLDALHERHRCVDGTVVEAQESRRTSSDYTAFVLWVASPDAPGLEWLVVVPRTADHHPAAGDPVRIWYHPDDPEAAVLCVPGDVVSRDARMTQARRAAAAVPAPPPAELAVLVVLPALHAELPFPRAALDRWRPRPAGRPLGVALGVLLGVVAAVVSGPERVESLSLPVVRAAALASAVAVGALLRTRGHPVGFGVATVLATALAAAGSGDSQVAMVVTVLLGIMTWATVRERTVRRRTWERLGSLFEAHERADGVVERVDVRPHAQNGDTVTVRAVRQDDPARGWTVRDRVTVGLRPYPGQPVVVWTAGGDSGAAVLGVLDARLDPRWTGTPARS